MTVETRTTLELGALITAAYDLAARLSASPEEIAQLASGAVLRMLRRSRYTCIEVSGPDVGVMGFLTKAACNDSE
jgi:hypothetical protein